MSKYCERCRKNKSVSDFKVMLNGSTCLACISCNSAALSYKKLTQYCRHRRQKYFCPECKSEAASNKEAAMRLEQCSHGVKMKICYICQEEAHTLFQELEAKPISLVD